MDRNMWRTNGRMNFPLDGLALYIPLWHPELSGSPITAKIPLGGGITGTVEGAIHVPPTHRSFDGDDYISLGTPSSLVNLGTSSFTFIVWAKSGDTNTSILLGGGESGVNPNAILGMYASGRVIIGLEADDGSGKDSTDDGDTFNDNAWHIIAGVVNRTTDVATRFKDAVATGTADSISGVNGAITLGTDFGLGAWGDGTSLPFTGNIGEGWFYLNAMDIRDLEHIKRATQWRYV